ncbi:MAG: hypothetical protein ACRDV0_04125, partial [Acidimicrobiales bacterium]
MKVPRRLPALALAVVALGLTVTGVVLAATDSSPGGASHDPLALNGYPPRTAQLHVVVSTGQLYDVTADVSVNFLTNAVAGEVHVPFAFSTADLDLRLVGGRAYLSSSSLPSVM